MKDHKIKHLNLRSYMFFFFYFTSECKNEFVNKSL